MTTLPKARHGRPRGFIQWNPRASTLRLIDAVKEVLADYAEFLPLSIRQIFYRLVVTTNYEKSERAYSRLCETLNRARRARLIDFDAIRDDGFHRTGFIGWNSIEHAQNYLRHQAVEYRIDRQRGQELRLVVWCEAQGMVPQLEQVAEPFSIRVYSSGGFDSVTAKHSVAQEFSAMDQVCVLHVGDHDPSGVHVFGSLDEDITAFLAQLGGYAEFVRVAVTTEQIQKYGLPTAPPKSSDHRAFKGLTTQAEALPPDLLASVLRQEILSRLDIDIYEQAVEMEQEERARLLAWLDGVA